jgi:hypothetical protein
LKIYIRTGVYSFLHAKLAGKLIRWSRENTDELTAKLRASEKLGKVRKGSLAGYHLKVAEQLLVL